MTTAAKEGSGLAETAAAALRAAAAQAGLSTRGARLIRVFSSAVYYLPAAGAVARVAQQASPAAVSRLAVSVQVTTWLTRAGFPSVEPLPIDQPCTSHGCVVTFWKHLPQHGPTPGAADLGSILRQLHHLPPPPVALPAYQPLTSVRRAIPASRAVTGDDRAWLARYCDQLLDAYAALTFQLPGGLIHGDAWRGNLLRDASRVVLIDWDTVSTGPREIDLIPTLQAPRFGLSPADRDAFISAYGHDIRSWDGYRVLRDIRELSTISALLRDGHASPAAYRELHVRLRSIRTGDSHHWASF